MIKEIEIQTDKRYQLVDITSQVEEIVEASRIKEGVIFIFLPHSTAGIVLTENESGLKNDWLKLFEKLTSGIDFQHNLIDNNADSHLLSGLVGQGKFLPIENGRVIRGTWQQIFLVEFDGPRKRKVYLKLISVDKEGKFI